MKTVMMTIWFIMISAVNDYAFAEDNQTMLGGFDFHGTVSNESKTTELLVTGNFVFPIVNKYKKGDPITNEPGKIIERLEWKLNVEKFPIVVERVSCALIKENQIKNVGEVKGCLNKRVSITIGNPKIKFNEFGLAVGLETENANIVPFDIIKSSGGR